MKSIRRLAFAALGIAYAQIVFGAVVRITGSGLGCGDHWPRCMGHWLPPLDQPTLIIEVTHRYLAATLGFVMLALLVTVWRRRHEPRVGGRGGVLRSALLATVLVGVVGGLGRVIVRNALDPRVIVVHLALAMSVLAALAATVMRAGGLGAAALEVGDSRASARTRRSSAVAAALIGITVVLGALTANLPGAASSCIGFPLCRGVAPAGFSGMRTVQLVHRSFALLALLHLTGVVIGSTRRRDPAIVRTMGRLALGIGVTQILIAAAMVEMSLPRPLQSLHQAVGTLLWLATFVFAALVARSFAAAGTRKHHVAPTAVEESVAGAPVHESAARTAIPESVAAVPKQESVAAAPVRSVPPIATPLARRSDIESPGTSAPPDSAPDNTPETPPGDPSPTREPGERPETDQQPIETESHPDSPIDVPADESPGVGNIDTNPHDVTQVATARKSRAPTMAVIIARGADF